MSHQAQKLFFRLLVDILSYKPQVCSMRRFDIDILSVYNRSAVTDNYLQTLLYTIYLSGGGY